MLFTPRGDMAQWRVLYEHMKTMNIGEVFTHLEMQVLLPGVASEGVRGAFLRALREVEDLHHRSFENVRGVGYRVAEARQHESLARKKHKTARRTLDAALRKTQAADRSQLTPEERRRLDALEHHLTNHKSMLDQLKRRQKNTEELVQKTEQRVSHTEKDLQGVDERLSILVDQLRAKGLLDREE